MRCRTSIACTLASLLVSGCGSGPAHDEDSVATTASALTVPAGCATLDFDVDAPDKASIALTFDDGPEYGGTTLKTLDILKSAGVHATFFINTNDAIDVLASSSGRLAVQRMVAEGHEVGNHTVHHYSLSATSTDVNAELGGVVSVLRTVAPAALANRLVRAPYGEPYFGPQATLDSVAPIIARYGVHVGWNIDSRDWDCSSATDPAACVKKNVLDLVDAGRSGLVLLHSTQPATVAALPELIVALGARGKKFIGVEALVVAKYGKPSRRLFRCSTSSDCYGGDVCGTDNRCAAPPPIVDSGAPDTSPPDTATAVDSSPAVIDSGVSSDTSIPAERLGAATELSAPWRSSESADNPASDANEATSCEYAYARNERWFSFALALALFVVRRASRGCAVRR